MAVDMFLKFEGVDGESQDSAHTGEIDVLAWSWGMSQSGTMHAGGGGGGGKVNVNDVSITKYVDKASPNLMKYCSNGSQVGEAILTVRKAGGKEPLEYIIITMTDVIVTSVSHRGKRRRGSADRERNAELRQGQGRVPAPEAGRFGRRRKDPVRLEHRPEQGSVSRSS